MQNFPLKQCTDSYKSNPTHHPHDPSGLSSLGVNSNQPFLHSVPLTKELKEYLHRLAKFAIITFRSTDNCPVHTLRLGNNKINPVLSKHPDNWNSRGCGG